MSRVLVIAEHNGRTLNVSTARVMACARALAPDIIDVAVFIGVGGGSSVAEAVARLDGVSKVRVIERTANEAGLSCVLTPQIVALSADYSHLLGPNTTFGRDLMPRVAAKLCVSQVSEIMRVESPTIYDRPIYAGNAVVTVETHDEPVVGTVRTASFKAVSEQVCAPIETVNIDLDLPVHTRFIGLESSGGERPDLQSASIVVSGGRGVGSQKNFHRIFEFADKLGAGVGATRAAVDAGFVPNELQIGQTGKIIAPDLYFAFGISGAIQHLAGIMDAGTIVAVNTDADAPIFEVADFGLVGDLHVVIPELEKALGI